MTHFLTVLKRNEVRLERLLPLFLFFFFSAAALVQFGFLESNVNLQRFNQEAISQLASGVGAQAMIAPNPVNTLAQQLRDKEAALKEREQLLNKREALLTRSATRSIDITTFYYTVAISALLFMLVVANFVFDYRRIRTEHIRAHLAHYEGAQ